MLPLFDENPTNRTPFVTWAIIGLCLLAYAAPRLIEQNTLLQTSPDVAIADDLADDVRLLVEHAAIPCEIIQRRPLAVEEVRDTYVAPDGSYRCATVADGPAVFPDKYVSLAMVTSLFLHGGLFHLASNMLFLWVFGNNVEDRVGHLPFALFFVTAGVVGTIAYVASQPDSAVAIVGASGAVAGVMGSYAVWYPDAPIRTLVFLILVDIRAQWFLIAWFLIQFLTADGPGAWITHVSGFCFGIIIGRIIRKVQPLLQVRPGQPAPAWDETGGAGLGPYPHLDTVWVEPRPDRYIIDDEPGDTTGQAS